MYPLAVTIVGITVLGVVLVFRRRIVAACDWALERADQWLDARRTRRGGEWPTATVLLLPGLAVIGVFGAAPLFYALYLSVRRLDFGTWRYIGMAHYREALRNEELWHSLLVTTYFAVTTIPLTLVISFLVAWRLFRIQWAQGLFRTAYFLPYVTSAVAAATVWRVLLRPQLGGVNGFLAWIGMEPQRWLLEPRGILAVMTDGALPAWIGPSLALCCIIAFEVWHNMGFMIVVLLAGLSAMPRDLEEAALIDGASRRQVLQHVVIPMLSPIIFFLITVGTIHAFQAFNSFYALTVGMRRLDTQNMVMLVYAQIYENQRYGYGAAIAVILSAVIASLTAIQWRLGRRRVHHE